MAAHRALGILEGGWLPLNSSGGQFLREGVNDRSGTEASDQSGHKDIRHEKLEEHVAWIERHKNGVESVEEVKRGL